MKSWALWWNSERSTLLGCVCWILSYSFTRSLSQFAPHPKTDQLSYFLLLLPLLFFYTGVNVNTVYTYLHCNARFLLVKTHMRLEQTWQSHMKTRQSHRRFEHTRQSHARFENITQPHAVWKYTKKPCVVWRRMTKPHTVWRRVISHTQHTAMCRNRPLSKTRSYSVLISVWGKGEGGTELDLPLQPKSHFNKFKILGGRRELFTICTWQPAWM